MAQCEDSKETDLFGNEVFAVKRKQGRPPFERTQENANKVSMLLALGWKNEEIAACVVDPRTGKAISLPTLKRHFRAELAERHAARLRMEARKMQVCMDSAFSGNVGAMRLFEQLVEKNDRMLIASQLPKGDQEKTTKAMGKKASALASARAVASSDGDEDNGSWGGLLSPGEYTN